jgi:hypothetical protein
MIGKNGLLKQLTKALLERAMHAELTEHVGYEKHDPAGPARLAQAIERALISCRRVGNRLRIPSDADQRSELMAIAIPNSCRSPFQSDGDHRSKPMPITRPLG